jgi:hypothetical protein
MSSQDEYCAAGRGPPGCQHPDCSRVASTHTGYTYCDAHEGHEGADARPGVGSEFTFFAGASSGSGRKALRQLEVKDVMINYATKLNEPWDIPNLFIDCGGYSFMMNTDMGDYSTSDAEYLDYVERVEPEKWALRDYPCEPSVLQEHNRTVAEHQQRTTERHRNLMDLQQDRGVPGQPVSVIQGWGKRDYLSHLDTLRSHGVLTDYVGIGSVCRRNREDEIAKIIHAVRDALPSRCDLHAFGVKVSVLRNAELTHLLTSVDSQAFEFEARYSNEKQDWHDVAFEYLRYKKKVDNLAADSGDSVQATLGVSS